MTSDATPSVTVLIDTYNYGHFIESAINSILVQDFPMEEVQILVVDDGSTDDTARRVEKFGSKISYIRKRNGGQASAFNVGFASAKGKIVVMLDADDYFLPGKLRRVAEEFDKNPEAGLVYHRLLELYTDSNTFKEMHFSATSGFLRLDMCELLKYFPHPTSSLAFRRSIVNKLIPMPESMRIQADAYLEMLTVLLAPVVAISQPLAVYRIHGKNLCITDYQKYDSEAVNRLIRSNGKVVRGLNDWSRKHKGEVGGVSARPFFSRLLLPLLEEQFKSNPPGRLQFCRYLFFENYTYSAQQTWRFTAYKYLTSLLGLALGYERRDVLNQWSERIMQNIKTLMHG